MVRAWGASSIHFSKRGAAFQDLAVVAFVVPVFHGGLDMVGKLADVHEILTRVRLAGFAQIEPALIDFVHVFALLATDVARGRYPWRAGVR
jgi:hypothetical protein